MLNKLSQKKQIEYGVLYKSLIGKEITITFSKIKTQIGLKGTIIYESANFLHVKVEKELKTVKIFKNNVFFDITIDGKALNMDARLLFSTVLHRIKKIK